ncbi:MAG TPA: hypothetical protein VFI31_01440, partial [Pirellulales bacterium]|nr:hypothetical protein [Pirellulales bacterium]
ACKGLFYALLPASRTSRTGIPTASARVLERRAVYFAACNTVSEPPSNGKAGSGTGWYRRGMKKQPTGYLGAASQKIIAVLDATPRTVNEVNALADRCGTRPLLDSLVKKGLAKKARIDGRVRYWLVPKPRA